MALSHCEASDDLAENGAGKTVLISLVEVEVPAEGWVDMGFEGLTGFTGGTGVRVIIVTVLISPVEVKVPVEGWVDMAFEGLTGLTGGTGVRMIIVTGLTDIGTWGKGVLGNWGVTTVSKRLLGFGSGLMVSGSWLRWKRHLEMVVRMGESYS